MGNLSLSQVVSNQNNKETTINDATAQLEQALTEKYAKALDGLTSPITLTTAEYLRAMRLDFTGALTADFVANVPAVKKLTIVSNSTTGGHDVTVQIAGGTGVTLHPGQQKIVFADGVNVNLVMDLTQKVGFFQSGKPGPGAQLLRMIAPFNFTVKAGVPGARYTNKTNPADATQTFSIQKNDVEFATVAVTTAGVVTFTCAADTSFNDNADILSIVAPATQDSALADVSIILPIIRST